MAEPVDQKAAHAPTPRPSVLSLNINSKSALYAAYMPQLRHGGIFFGRIRLHWLRIELLRWQRLRLRSHVGHSGW